VKIARPREIDGDLFEALIAVLERNPPVRWEFVHLFGAIDIAKGRAQRVRKILKIGQDSTKPIMRYRLPALEVGSDVTTASEIEGQLHFFTEKPPSFTRAFCRCLFSQLVPPISETVVNAIGAVLTPVHPRLFSAGLLHIGVRITPAIPVSLLRLGGIPRDVAAELKACGGDVIPFFEEILKLDQEGIAAVLPGIENRGGKDAAIAEFVQAAAGPGADVQFADAVFQVLERLFSVEILLTVICTNDFLSQPNLICVVHIFRKFVALLKRKEKLDFLEFIEAFIGSTGQIAGNGSLAMVFRDLNRAETIARVLHEPE
jgi:hypothetical protein